MQYLWPAIKTRFESHAKLVATARKIYRQFTGRKDVPYVECHQIGGDRGDTFGKDLKTIDIQFSIFTKKDRRGIDADEIVHWMEDAFNSADLKSPSFITVDCFPIGGISGPELREGVYQTIMRYRIQYQRVLLHPAVRGV